MCKMMYEIRKDFIDLWVWYWPSIVSIVIGVIILGLFIFAGVD